MAVRATLRRWHVWLGWLVGVPVLFWTVSGLVMVARPIEDVRGTALVRPAAPLTLAAPPVFPGIDGLSVDTVTLVQTASGPRWIVKDKDGRTRQADPATGSLLPPLSAPDALREVTSRYAGKATPVAVTRTRADEPPLELRRPLDTWRVEMSDGTRLYVDQGSGEIVARRTRWWRIYDFFWGLHIMDLQGREQPHNPWIVTFSALTVLMSFLALALLGLTVKRPQRRQPPNSPTHQLRSTD